MLFFGAPEGGMSRYFLNPRITKTVTLAECPRLVFGNAQCGRRFAIREGQYFRYTADNPCGRRVFPHLRLPITKITSQESMVYTKVVRLIRTRYQVALTLIAALATTAYLTLQGAATQQRQLTLLVEMIGQQSGQAQRIAYLSLLLMTTADNQGFSRARAELGRSIGTLRQLHETLRAEMTTAEGSIGKSSELRVLYFDESTGLDIALENFLGNAAAVFDSEPETLGSGSYAQFYLGDHGLQALESALDAVAGEYRNLRAATELRKQRLQHWFWLATLLLLLLEALFIFNPLEVRIRNLTSNLRRRVARLESSREQYVVAREKAESASEAKSQFLATMTHELRTPMNGVLGMSELLSASKLDAQQNEYVQIIVDSSESLLAIINDILDFSRLEAGKVGLEKIPFNLEQSAYDVMALLAPRCQNKTLQLILDFAPDLPRHFIGDPARIRQIFFNLIGNSIKFTENGYIQVSIAVDVDQSQRAAIAIHVEDTGIGIAPDKVEQLFSSFTQADSSTTRKYGGTGLGLSITRELVTLMGGHIAVDSGLGKGSVFSLDFELELADQSEEIPIPKGAINHVMLLEPNEIYRDLIIDRLGRIEVETAVVASADEIKDRLKIIAEHGGAPQIVIVSQEAILDPSNHWRDFKQGRLTNPTSWLVLGNSDEESDRFRKRARHLQGHTTFMQKPFTNYQFYYALNTSMHPDDDFQNLPAGSEDATDFTLSKASRGNILLVEDNLANQKFASLLLSKMGFNTDIAEHGREAIGLWREQDYDLILMDCLMPNMDGYQATKKIRMEENGGSRIPIIALTANASEKDRAKCHKAGMDEVITKPYRKHELADLLDRWLNDEPSFITIRHNLG